MDAVGDGTRRAILERLLERPSAVGELAAGLPVSRPAVSQHLRILEDASLVLHTTQGTRNIYRVAPRGLGALRAYLDAMWGRALLDFKAVAEATYKTKRKGSA